MRTQTQTQTQTRRLILLTTYYALAAGAEAQAIKRVDRIGQAHATCVHRFVVSASIEENVAALFGARAEAAATGDAAVAGGGGAAGVGLRASEVVSLLRN